MASDIRHRFYLIMSRDTYLTHEIRQSSRVLYVGLTGRQCTHVGVKGATTFSITTFRIMTLGMKGLFVTLGIKTPRI
jgi:hypothetical protein